MIRSLPTISQGKLIKVLSPKIRGWTNYHRTVIASGAFNHCRYVLFRQLLTWAYKRHPTKGKQWVTKKYWHHEDGTWTFTDGKSALWNHDRTSIQRHIKVKGTASPYDGNLLYWSKRLRDHPLLSGTKARLLQKQQGKCRWCELYFQDGDQIEIDHILPRSLGGGEELSNKFALHRHCHDARHTKGIGTYDKGSVAEEPDAGKLACPVLKTSRRGDSPA
jgi:RNA-directed DNA polymerase